MDAQFPLVPWPGFEPMRLGDLTASRAHVVPLYHGLHYSCGKQGKVFTWVKVAVVVVMVLLMGMEV